MGSRITNGARRRADRTRCRPGVRSLPGSHAHHQPAAWTPGEILARAMIDNLNRFMHPQRRRARETGPPRSTRRLGPQPRRPARSRPTRTTRRPPTQRRPMAGTMQSRQRVQNASKLTPGSHEEPPQVATPKPSLTDPSPPPSGAHERERHDRRAKVDNPRAA